ncbi:MAG: hypothetical protein VYC91_01060 [Acidobacteriota bacterium]|nr:hypothetical protein [Acidobacteriota bacterium]
MTRISLPSDQQCQIRNSQMAERRVTKAKAYTQFMPNMGRLLSVQTDIGVPFGKLFARLMTDPARLTRLQREMIAVVTSQANRCRY